ncbi:hypothetical protein FRB90_002921 [Tulasnella sp. 427]|nr:hypothetical protein FRB90_002921 [Tulasnella sp. 427]
MKVAAALSALAFAGGALAVAEYGQCGGINGVTGTCDSGLVCVVQNAYYYQCLTPSSGQTTAGGSAATTTSKTSTTTKTSSTTTKTSTTSTKTSSSTKTTTTTKTSSTTVGSAPTGITTTLPASSGYSALPTASVITGTFDGGMKRFDRAGSSGACQEQTETGEEDAVFILESGATIQNVIIGADQAEGIHCRGPCTVKNVWWADVCEDAITIKQTGSGDVSYIIGGGAFHAEDKIVQHNGAGTVSIKNFYANDFGKLYRSCGNCSKSYERHVIVDNVALIGGSTGVGINENFGDTATLTNVCTNGKPSATNVCCRYEGTTPGNEPDKIGCGPSGNVGPPNWGQNMRNKRKSGVAGFLSALAQPVVPPTQPPASGQPDLPNISAPGPALGSGLLKRDLSRSTDVEVNTDERPSKRRKVAGILGPGYEEFDASDLVPFATKASEIPKHLSKYFYQRERYFSLYDEGCLLDEEGWYSVTPERIADQIAERCRCGTILDAFCGVGGNSIAFAKTCERVLALDNSPTRLALARHNATIYGVQDRIDFILCDYLDFARAYAKLPPARRTIEVVFLSPPWGGPQYLLSSSINGKAATGDDPSEPSNSGYSLDSILPIPGDELFHLTRAISGNIAYFLPRNTDLKEVSKLGRQGEKIEVEEEWMGEKLKAVTCYFGGLAAGQEDWF